jgi:Holliday junction DNA helicase RuvA
MMFEYIKGTVEGIGNDYIIIENNHMGYRVYTSRATIQELQEIGGVVKLYTSLLVREDDLKMCGFFEPIELELFHMLLGVSGVGPKMALGILSAFEYNDMIHMIGTENDILLTKAPGVGKKTAQRIILELKDKVNKVFGSLPQSSTIISSSSSMKNKGIRQDITDALMGLGFSGREIGTMLASQNLDELTVEEAIKIALKSAGSR